MRDTKTITRRPSKSTQQAKEKTMTTELVTQDVRPIEVMKLTAAEIRADVNLIQQVLKAVMKKDVHYGVIPGTPKPTLYKPGAEKILSTFRLNAEPLIEDLSSPDEIRYRIRIRVTHQVTKLEIGWGVGECSSDETKYKWVKPVCNEEYDETPEDRRREKWMKGKDGKPNYKQKQIRPNLKDVANTILKMSKKRGLVDATLTCTGASDVFDQDIEDMPENLRQNVADSKLPPIPARTAAPSMTQPPAAGAVNEEEEELPRAKINLEGAREMLAKFDAPCRICEEIIQTGMPMLYIGMGVDKGRYHVAHRSA